jgi:hypothetical protein
MMDNLGSVSNAWVTRSLMSLINMAAARGKPASSDDINAALAFIAAIDPQNEMEAALAMQMFATHDLSMEMMRSAKHAGLVCQIESYGNLATKMARTFTGQIEALAKLRRGGEQIVRHIHVDNRGGQAVIAETLNTGGAGNGKIADQPYGQSAILSALPGPDEAGNGVPISCDARPETMSHPRRNVPRRPSGQQARS